MAIVIVRTTATTSAKPASRSGPGTRCIRCRNDDTSESCREDMLAPAICGLVLRDTHPKLDWCPFQPDDDGSDGRSTRTRRIDDEKGRQMSLIGSVLLGGTAPGAVKRFDHVCRAPIESQHQ